MVKTTSLSLLGPVVFLFLSGCAERQAGKYNNVNREAAKLVIGASDHLREMFNQGACQSIYHQATGYFRQMPEAEWDEQCEQLRRRLGKWAGFEVHRVANCGAINLVVCYDGLASFGNASYPVEAAWKLDTDQARLLWLVLGGPKNQIQLPPLKLNLIDPPSKKSNNQSV